MVDPNSTPRNFANQSPAGALDLPREIISHATPDLSEISASVKELTPEQHQSIKLLVVQLSTSVDMGFDNIRDSSAIIDRHRFNHANYALNGSVTEALYQLIRHFSENSISVADIATLQNSITEHDLNNVFYSQGLTDLPSVGSARQVSIFDEEYTIPEVDADIEKVIQRIAERLGSNILDSAAFNAAQSAQSQQELDFSFQGRKAIETSKILPKLILSHLLYLSERLIEKLRVGDDHTVTYQGFLQDRYTRILTLAACYLIDQLKPKLDASWFDNSVKLIQAFRVTSDVLQKNQEPLLERTILRALRCKSIASYFGNAAKTGLLDYERAVQTLSSSYSDYYKGSTAGAPEPIIPEFYIHTIYCVGEATHVNVHTKGVNKTALIAIRNANNLKNNQTGDFTQQFLRNPDGTWKIFTVHSSYRRFAKDVPMSEAMCHAMLEQFYRDANLCSEYCWQAFPTFYNSIGSEQGVIQYLETGSVTFIVPREGSQERLSYLENDAKQLGTAADQILVNLIKDDRLSIFVPLNDVQDAPTSTVKPDSTELQARQLRKATRTFLEKSTLRTKKDVIDFVLKNFDVRHINTHGSSHSKLLRTLNGHEYEYTLGPKMRSETEGYFIPLIHTMLNALHIPLQDFNAALAKVFRIQISHESFEREQ